MCWIQIFSANIFFQRILWRAFLGNLFDPKFQCQHVLASSMPFEELGGFEPENYRYGFRFLSVCVLVLDSRIWLLISRRNVCHIGYVGFLSSFESMLSPYELALPFSTRSEFIFHCFCRSPEPEVIQSIWVHLPAGHLGLERSEWFLSNHHFSFRKLAFGCPDCTPIFICLSIITPSRLKIS